MELSHKYFESNPCCELDIFLQLVKFNENKSNEKEDKTNQILHLCQKRIDFNPLEKETWEIFVKHSLMIK